jgi:ATP-dependent DNA helicase RecQ
LKKIAFFDIELNPKTENIQDIGGIKNDGSFYHKNSIEEFTEFIKDQDYLCGHNIISHDLKHIQKKKGNLQFGLDKAIDTLFLSPLLFPKTPYHSLLKDDKLQTEERNNPLNDSKKARDLFFDEVNAYNSLNEELKSIYYNLLKEQVGFKCFFDFCEFSNSFSSDELEKSIRSLFKGAICDKSDLTFLIQENKVALSYALSLLYCNDKYSITPPWVLKNHPDVERILFLLRTNPCVTGCEYCDKALDPVLALNKYFGFPSFRSYGGIPLQEQAVKATVNNKSVLAVFPTGGGKSITFQIPALMSGENAKALTVVISPLQSLMKDQVDNLEKKGITDAVTINGLLDPIERSKAIERVENGSAFLLYISPESLRSVTIERLLLKRKIARFVVDEAHCFSSWGQDFRVDYLYIGDFINKLQEKKNLPDKIPVSCFTATAKQKVIEDIKEYFKSKLDLDLEVFRTDASRTNLQYRVFQKDNEEDKYAQLRNIIETKECPAIVYVSRTKRAADLANRLSEDGFKAKPYHGKMDKDVKTANQNAFMNGEVDIMVATSAFGMGVDKNNVEKVIHYDISDSLENYVQEAGRAGRDENINAECFVLFNEEDLDKHFILLNQTKISSKEINQIWKAIKDLTRTRENMSNSALEIARKAGWDENITEIETRVTTAIAALEDAGYLKRGQNFPRVFANSILSKNAEEAITKINSSTKFSDKQKENGIRVIKKLFSSKSKRLSTEEVAESRVDYISDQLGIVKHEIIRVIELLKEENILAQTKDLTAYIKRSESINKSLAIAEGYRKLEEELLASIREEESAYHLKELNEHFIDSGIKDCNPNRIKTILNFWAIKHWIKRQNHESSKNHIHLVYLIPKDELRERLIKKRSVSKFIIEYLHKKSDGIKASENNADEVLIEFSVLELKEAIEKEQGLFREKVSIDDVEDALFYLSRIEALKIEGGFLVVYNKLSIDRLEKNNRIQYKESDYEKLRQFYQQKVQQIHIVGEYAKKMIRNYKEALQFVDDYFNLNYSSFLNKYFPGSRQDDIKRTLTPEKFKKLFGELSVNQLEIIKDSTNQHIVVAAGPGSGKTRVLVHKLASLLLTEDVKHEQLLMLAFSRAAVNEFKKKLLELIGNAAYYIEIKTFHSYCFDLLGRIGNLYQSDDIIKNAVDKIKNGDIELSHITKTVLVIDEAQDINSEEYELIQELMKVNEEMRVIFVGDDDQNIYEFRKSDSKYMQQLITIHGAAKYELTENYRSKANIVNYANQWATTIPNRLKSEPGISIQQANGKIAVVEYKSPNLIVPLVNEIIKTEFTGSTCVLTKTNEEATQIVGLLIKKGLQAKLIQSNDGFNLSTIEELRFFSDLVITNGESPNISDDDWEEDTRKLTTIYKESSKLSVILNIKQEFERLNTKKKYKSDWKAFVEESKLEDFININTETIYVSTIHKAKGKEFDNVLLMLNGFRPDTNENKKQVYVAITRPKTNLSIHCNGDYLRQLKVEGCTYRNDHELYSEPEQIVLQLNHKQVILDHFINLQDNINLLKSGGQLTVRPDGLGTSNVTILKFSKAFRELLEGKSQKGYRLSSAKINFIVHWKKPETDLEVKIVLPEVTLSK